jgi:sulfite reductase alpha subunit-like flavoprotein
MPPNRAFYKAVKSNVGFPVIMVAPGTGVAPCRSLIWQRVAEAVTQPEDIREMVLFFGNRNKDADYFFKDEWEDPSVHLDVFTAFSRDQKEKIYVQDLIRRESKLVHKLLCDDALIIVCGSSGKMPQQVREAFMDVIEEHAGPFESREKVEECFASIEKSGKYLQETW